jgi:hypothetical protein
MQYRGEKFGLDDHHHRRVVVARDAQALEPAPSPCGSRTWCIHGSTCAAEAPHTPHCIHLKRPRHLCQPRERARESVGAIWCR